MLEDICKKIIWANLKIMRSIYSQILLTPFIEVDQRKCWQLFCSTLEVNIKLDGYFTGKSKMREYH